MTRKKAPASTAKTKRTVRRARKSARGAREHLATELYAAIRLLLKRFHVTPSEQTRAFARARWAKSPPPVSGRLLRDMYGVSEILLEWSRAAAYLDEDGKPRVLAIRGPGATFESLARRFLPDKRIDEAVEMTCATSEVATRPGNGIALLGNTLVNVTATSESCLAHAIRQIGRLSQTIQHNAEVNVNGIRTGGGHMERAVQGVIPRSAVNGFIEELRPQIYDLLQRVDATIKGRQPHTPRSSRDATAVSVSVYVSQEEDLERAGADSQSLLPRRARNNSNKRGDHTSRENTPRASRASSRKTRR